MGLQNALMSDLLSGHEVVEGVELIGVRQLVGEGSTRMADELVGDADQSLGAALVAEAGESEMDAAEAGFETGDSLHDGAPGARSRDAIRGCGATIVIEDVGELEALHTALMTQCVNWVLDADFRKFFDSAS